MSGEMVAQSLVLDTVQVPMEALPRVYDDALATLNKVDDVPG